MTKGLHKNSLRKGDNPNQWMIDDARMELIQQIKAEVERRIKRNKEEYAPDGLFEVQDNLAKLLSFLSTLESEKPMELEEEVKRYYSDNFEYLSSDQPTLSILTNIARHFAKWGAEHLKK